MSQAPPVTAAVVCDAGSAAAEQVRVYAEAQGLSEAHWYARRDIDDVDRAIRAGSLTVVVFPDAAALLHATWSGRIDVPGWVRAHADIRLAQPAVVPGTELLHLIGPAWCEWRRRQRHRQAIAGLILSLVALAAATTLLWLPLLA